MHDVTTIETKPATWPAACPAARAADLLLAQCEDLLSRMDDAAYTRASVNLPGGTIGKHLRHAVDHYRAALIVLDDSGAVIDYDHRERDVPMETDRAAALGLIASVRRGLLRIDEAVARRRVTVRLMFAADGHCADLPSTLGREVAFAAHHAVHHHAMMKVIAREAGVSTPDTFGVAPSTLNHERTAGAAG